MVSKQIAFVNMSCEIKFIFGSVEVEVDLNSSSRARTSAVKFAQYCSIQSSRESKP